MRPLRPTPERLRAGLALAAATLAVRLPFLTPGYGVDSDAWGLARAARTIGTTGRYAASRFPGNPLQEWLSAPFWWGGPLALNGLTALMSVLCTLLTYRLLLRTGVRDAWLGAFAFAMVPTVFLSSVCAIDYLWALAFILLAFDRALGGSAALAGLFLGVATGGRITSIALLLPLLVVLGAPARPRRLSRLALASAIAVAVGAAFYVPNYLHYGFGFLSYYEPHQATHSAVEFLAGMFRPGPPSIPLVFVLGQATVLVFGIVGTAGLAAAVAIAAGARLFGQRLEPELAGGLPRPVLVACGLSVLLVCALYLRLPHDEGYLIPALPFLMILLASALPRAAFRTAAFALVISPFLFGADLVPPKKGLVPLSRSAACLRRTISGQQLVVDVLRGPVIQDHDKRVRAQMILDAAFPLFEALPDSSLLIAGTLAGPVFLRHWRDPEFADVVPLKVIEERIGAGKHVYYLPDLPERTMRIYGYDLTRTGATPLLPDAPAPESRP